MKENRKVNRNENRKEKEHVFAICAYKESPYLEACICSLLQQTVKSKILLSTSTPNTYIRKVADRYHIPCFINPDSGGISGDWNFAYRCARMEYAASYITLVHQDDIYEPEYLETALRALEERKAPLLFFSDYYEIREGKCVGMNRLLFIKRILLFPLRLSGLQEWIWLRRRILSFGSPICCPAVTYACDFLPLSIFRKHFRVCVDWEAWERISRRKGSFLYTPKRLVGHRIHAGSETSAAIGENIRSREEYEMFRKFWPSWMADLLEGFYQKGQKSNALNE